MKLRKFASFFLLIIFVCQGCGKQQSGVITIGAVFPITKNGAQYGQYFKEGSELALRDAIGSGIVKEGDVRLIIEDGQGDATTSVNAFNKLVDQNGISWVLTALSSVTLAIKPIANEKHIPLVNANAFSTDIDDADDFCFSILPNAKEYGNYLAKFTYDSLKQHEIGILYRNDASGVSFTQWFVETYNGMGGQVAFKESHESGQTDFRTIISKFKQNRQVKFIFMPSYGVEIANFIKEATELNYDVKVITYQSFFIPEAIKLAGRSASNVVFVASKFDPNSADSTTIRFRNELMEFYRSADLNYYVAAEYDAMLLLLKAISAGNRTGDEIRAYLKGLNTYQGITGDIHFDEKGACTMPLKAYTVKDSSFVAFH